MPRVTNALLNFLGPPFSAFPAAGPPVAKLLKDL